MTNLPAAPRRWLLPLIALLVLSTACTVRFQTDVVLSEDNTATLDLIIGVRFEGDLPPEATEGAEDMDPEETASEIRALADQCGFSEDAVTAGEYTEDDFMGVQITLTSVPIESINCFLGEDPDSPFEEFSIVRDGDDFVFNGTIDLNQAVAGSGLGQKRQVAQADEVAQDTPEEIQQQVDEAFSELEQQLEGLPTDFPTDFPDDLGSELENLGSEFEQGFEDALGGAAPEFEATVSVTFPGEVSEHNADTIEGNTVTWNLSVDSATTMMAVGSATEGGGSSNLLFVIIGVVVLLLILLGLFLFLRSRGKKKNAAAPPFGGPPGAGGYGAPGQPGPQGGFGAPPGAPQQPQGGFGAPPGAPQQPQGGYAGPPAAPQQPQGGFGVPGQAPSSGGFGVPGQGAPPQAGYQPQQPQPPQPQAPQQPQPPQPPQGDQPGGGGFDPSSTRTFRPEDLLPPEDPNNR